nr:MAG TPA: hypothetical protein [Caudoviricetes sp.]
MIDNSVSCIRRETPCRMASTGCVGGFFELSVSVVRLHRSPRFFFIV